MEKNIKGIILVNDSGLLSVLIKVFTPQWLVLLTSDKLENPIMFYLIPKNK